MHKILWFSIIIIIIGILGIFFWIKEKTSEPAARIPESYVPAGEASHAGEDGIYTVDTLGSDLAWQGSKTLIFNYKDTGNIALAEGSFTVRDGAIVSGKAVIDMATIEAKKTGNDKPASMLSGHLKSGDFFDVETYPTSTFELIKVTDAGEMHGNLTIKDQTHEISFPVSIENIEGELKIAGTAVVDRTKWGITYGSGSFFSNLGDNVIDDMFALSFNLSARQ